MECETAPTTPEMCDLDNFVVTKTNASGSFSTPFIAHRTLLTDTGLVDCAKQACVMLAAGKNFDKHATTPISFVTSGGPATTLTAKPSTKLLDQQKVALSGAGFRPSKPVLVAECLSNALGSACIGNAAKTAANGKIATSFTAQRILYSTSGTRVDCAKSATTCEMLVLDPADADYNATAPIAFNASVPPPPAPTVSVTPSTKLPFYAHVTFSGKHWAANDFPLIGECPLGERDRVPLKSGRLPDGVDVGAFTTTGIVSRYVTNPTSGKSIDCAKPANHCVVFVLGSNGAMATTPLSFDPAAPIPPPPSITLTPAGPYKGSQSVSFAGKNFAPNAEFSAGECIISNVAGACETGSRTNWVTDKNGNLHGSTTLVRRVSTPSGALDCLNAKTSCTFTVESLGNAEATTTLHFVAGSACRGRDPDCVVVVQRRRRDSGLDAEVGCHGLAHAPARATPAAGTWQMR